MVGELRCVCKEESAANKIEAYCELDAAGVDDRMILIRSAALACLGTVQELALLRAAIVFDVWPDGKHMADMLQEEQAEVCNNESRCQ